MNANTAKIQSLDSIRFFMIVLIILSHFTFFKQFEESRFVYETFFSHGGFAVDYFFTLSGFGMMYSCIHKEKKLFLDFRSLISFAVNHVRRLYGLYIVLLILCIPCDVISYYGEKGFLGIRFWLREIMQLVLCMPLLQSATGVTKFSHAFNDVSWFLSCIFCIYIISPVLLKCANKLKKTSALLLVLMLDVGVLFFVRLLFAEVQERTFFDDLIYGSPYCRVLYVFAGMLVAKIVVVIKSKLELCGKINYTLVELLTIVLMFGSYMAGVYRWPLDGSFTHCLWLCVSCVTLFVFCFENGAVSKILESWKHMGRLSMFLFLIHYPILKYTVLIIKMMKMDSSFYAYLLGSCTMLILTFIFSYMLLERNKNGLR